MNTARFITAARLELLAEIIYYNNAQSGLGTRFATAIEETTARDHGGDRDQLIRVARFNG